MPNTARSFRHAFAVLAYGESPFLPACLDSIAAQSRGGSEIVITTSTPSAYLEEAARRAGVPLLVNPQRASIGHDWNFALAATRCEYVTLAHQDDTYRPDYLEAMLGALAEESAPVIGFSDYDETASGGPREMHLNLRVKRFLCRRAFGSRASIHSSRDKRRLLEWGNPICCPSVVINRGAVPDFRFAESFHSNLDWEGWLRLADRPGAFVWVRTPLVTRRIHPHSETSNLIADRRRLLEDRAMFDRFWPVPIAALIAGIYRASYRANRT